MTMVMSYPPVICDVTNWKITIVIVDLPIDSMVIFYSYVSLPEGISYKRNPHKSGSNPYYDHLRQFFWPQKPR